LELRGREGNLLTNLEGKKMAAAMTKSKILDYLSKNLEVSKKQINEALSELVLLAYKEAKNSFTFPGLGKLLIVNRKARMGRNPQTGAAIKIPAKRVLKFRVAKACKDAVLGKK
jgi:DNA-binding protein HU-beta